MRLAPSFVWIALAGLVATAGCKTTELGEPATRVSDAEPLATTPELPPLGEEWNPPPADEGPLTVAVSQIFQGIVSMGYQSRKDSGDPRPARRDAHAKHHGCVAAEFTVAKNVPAEARHGLFAKPNSYKALIRFSNGSFQLKADQEGDAHGMAIKVLNVPGQKLLVGDEAGGETTMQDFVMIDHPVFFMRRPHDYISFMKAQGGGPQAVQAWAAEHQYEWGLIMATLAKKPDSPLQQSYFSQTPYKLGAKQAMKFFAKPCSGNQYVTIPAAERGPTYLKDTLAKHLASKSGCYDFYVQKQRDNETMPVEDPTILWPETWEGKATAVKVATIKIPAGQQSGTDDAMRLCEDMSFTPWHGLVEHRPLGGVNRIRRQVYVETSKHRHALNQAPLVVPTTADWQRLAKP